MRDEIFALSSHRVIVQGVLLKRLDREHPILEKRENLFAIINRE
jgi:hypothetical protein